MGTVSKAARLDTVALRSLVFRVEKLSADCGTAYIYIEFSKTLTSHLRMHCQENDIQFETIHNSNNRNSKLKSSDYLSIFIAVFLAMHALDCDFVESSFEGAVCELIIIWIFFLSPQWIKLNYPNTLKTTLSNWMIYEFDNCFHSVFELSIILIIVMLD